VPACWLEKTFLDRQARNEVAVRGLAAAAALLRTGTPPSDPYECVFAWSDGAVERHCTVTYASGEDLDTWDLLARPSTEVDIVDLPLAPESF
jgi:hypothetical protein